jgi:hypothetical protein
MSANNRGPQATPSGADGTSKKTEAPVTQEKKEFRQGWAEWAKQLPQINFPEQPNVDFELIDRDELAKIFASSKATPEAIESLNNDLAFLDQELLRLFRQRDFDAKFQQNRYRYYQIAYMLLAAGATVVGSFLAVSLNSTPDLVPFFGFLETVIAVMTTYLATISANEPALPLWIENRRKAEQMRREYYRFLMDLPPYNSADNYDRRRKLSIAVANINRGLAESPAIYSAGTAMASASQGTSNEDYPEILPVSPAIIPQVPGTGDTSGNGGAASPAITTPEVTAPPPASTETLLNPNDPTSNTPTSNTPTSAG